jgi:hypothetical protein
MLVSDEETPAGFEIDGARCPVPTLDSFTIDEAQVLYDYANLVLEDFAPAHPDASDEEREKHDQGLLAKVRNPGFKRALMHVALQRANPDMPAKTVEQHVGRANALDAAVSMIGGDVEDPTLGSQKQPSPGSDSRTLSPPSGSGSRSANGSGEPDGRPAPTGTIELVTSSPGSPLIGWDS